MAKKYYNINDFKITLSEEQSFSLQERRKKIDAMGDKAQFDVFLSHSTKDAALIKMIRDVLECEYNISVYIDWEEDRGTPRDEIADVVKSAMERSNSFLIVKTHDSDKSSWVSWETGYYDNKNCDKIGVLLVEDEDNKFTHETFEHQEYLKSYIIVGPEDVVDFIREGSSYIRKKVEAFNLKKFRTVKKPKEILRPHINE